MANNPIRMSKIRQILKLYSQHMGKRKIGNVLAFPRIP